MVHSTMHFEMLFQDVAFTSDNPLRSLTERPPATSQRIAALKYT